MKSLNIGFVGGCVNKQEGIKRQDLFYSIIQKELMTRIDLKVSLASYFSYELLPNDVLNFLNKKKPDILCLFIRPFPLMPLNKLFIKYQIEGRPKEIAFHSQLFDREMKWGIKFSNEERGPYISKKRKYFALKDLNIVAGFVLGLHHWANNYVIDRIEKVNDICLTKNVKLVVISPPKYTNSIILNFVSSRTTKYLEDFCKPKIIFVNINNINEFESDRIHLNRVGHRELGLAILRDIECLLE